MRLTAQFRLHVRRICAIIILLCEMIRLNTETYRSGHNGTDSKSVDPQGSVGSNPTVSARNHASSRFFRLLAFLFQFGAKPKPLSIASGIQMYVNVRRGGKVAVSQPLLNVLEGNAVGRGNIEFKHYQTLERFLEAARRSYAADRKSASVASRGSPETSETRWSGSPPASARPVRPQIQSHRIHSCGSCRRSAY